MIKTGTFVVDVCFDVFLDVFVFEHALKWVGCLYGAVHVLWGGQNQSLILDQNTCFECKTPTFSECVLIL